VAHNFLLVPDISWGLFGRCSDETSAFSHRASAEMDRGSGPEGAGLRAPGPLSGEGRCARRCVFFRSQARFARGDTAGLRNRGVEVVKFVAIAAASATIAATVAAAPLGFVHSLELPELLWNWWTWWQGDAVGIIIVAPLILGWAARGNSAWTPRKIAEGSLLVCLLSGVMYAIFGPGMAPYIPSLPLTFAILPFIIWAAFRFRQREVATVNALVCAMAVWFTLEGSGPFAQGSLNESLLLLLAFMCTVVT